MHKAAFSAWFLVLTLAAPSFAQWALAWSDEFDYSGLPDSGKWSYDVGGHGWGNQELQYYTDGRTENARVEDGKLIITVRKEKTGGNNYSSVRLITKNKGDWLYGRIEVAAKLPTGRGLWPAIWMLPTDWEYGGWPRSGEIDIMESVGYDPFRIFFGIHTEAYNHSIGTSKVAGIELDDPHRTFNVYAIEWDQKQITFLTNKEPVFTFKNEETGYKVWPFDKRFHLLINIAVGGSLGGREGVDENIFPQQMVIDYVRVYQKDSGLTESDSNGAKNP